MLPFMLANINYLLNKRCLFDGPVPVYICHKAPIFRILFTTFIISQRCLHSRPSKIYNNFSN